MNNRRVKKSVTTSLILLLTSSMLLAACSNASKTEDAGKTGAKDNTTTTTPKGPKPKIKVSVYDRNNVPEGEGKITDNRWTKWINENAPVEVEFVPVQRNNSPEKWNVLFASGEAPDLIFEYSEAYMKELAGKGQLMPLDDAIEKYAPTYKKILADNPILKTKTTFNDKTYFFGRMFPEMVTNHYLMVRKDWLDKLKLPMPNTAEEFYQVAKAFTEQDPDGNGKKDTYGSTLTDVDFFYGVGDITSPGSGAAASINMFHLQNDQFVHSWDRLQASQVLKKRLYDAGAVNKDFFADKNGEMAKQDWVNGKLGMYIGDNLEAVKGFSTYDTFSKNNPNADVALLPFPKTEFGQFAPPGATPFQLMLAVNATSKNVEAVMKYVEWMLKDETYTTLKYGMEGVNYKLDAAGCPKPIDTDKNKKEKDWNADFLVINQVNKLSKCESFTQSILDVSKPLDKKYAELISQGRKFYATPEHPFFNDITLPLALPDDLNVIDNSVKTTLINIFTKAVVSGATYTNEQAMKDAKDAWEKAGGKKIDDFYGKAYTDYKNKGVIFTKDYYKYVK
ncbi:Lipoprotein LipO [Paenibacillus allorhizoplanae]|uniref:Lipoprotein LipO n=1 Tax=Paenibacillus allorhizoplanae TaxID=2905648 RepID=A0ABN8G7V7_9BACL|nr:extracellular solute-binding protein [Paenibacillus allorhizoplanae]CAH1202279.1 Lipoprotein LipO [Paenibacillus allorhizoplanae]